MKKIRLAFYIVFLGIFIIAAAELALRFLAYPHDLPCIMHDAACFWRMAPNQIMHFVDDYGKPSVIKINSYGMRGPELDIEKAPGEKRIICVGDSFTYGLGVSDGHSYPAYLQKLVDNDFSNVKVINYGCNGHTILHEAELIKAYGLKFKPDYVIVGVTLHTDFSDIDELEYEMGFMAFPGYNFIKRVIRKSAIGNILLKYWNDEKVKAILNHRRQIRSMPPTVRDILLPCVYARDNKRYTMDVYMDKLGELVASGKDNGFKVVLLVMPAGKYSPEDFKILAVYHGKGEMTGTDYMKLVKERYGDDVTVVEVMSQFKSDDLFLLDGHANAKGNLLIASILYRQLKETLGN